MLKLYIYSCCKLTYLTVQFSVSSFDRAALVAWLGLGKKKKKNTKQLDSRLQMLKRSLELWSPAWHPSHLITPPSHPKLFLISPRDSCFSLPSPGFLLRSQFSHVSPLIFDNVSHFFSVSIPIKRLTNRAVAKDEWINEWIVINITLCHSLNWISLCCFLRIKSKIWIVKFKHKGPWISNVWMVGPPDSCWFQNPPYSLGLKVGKYLPSFCSTQTPPLWKSDHKHVMWMWYDTFCWTIWYKV